MAFWRPGFLATTLKVPDVKTPRPAGRFLYFVLPAEITQANYFADISATVVSSMRFEKPHSLSYHEHTFTRRPETLVSVASKLLDAGLWLKSIDTNGAVWYVRIPFNAPSA